MIIALRLSPSNTREHLPHRSLLQWRTASWARSCLMLPRLGWRKTWSNRVWEAMAALSRTILGMPKCRHRTSRPAEGAGGTRSTSHREEDLNMLKKLQQVKEERDQDQMAQLERIHKLSQPKQKMNWWVQSVLYDRKRYTKVAHAPKNIPPSQPIKNHEISSNLFLYSHYNPLKGPRSWISRTLRGQNRGTRYRLYRSIRRIRRMPTVTTLGS